MNLPPDRSTSASGPNDTSLAPLEQRELDRFSGLLEGLERALRTRIVGQNKVIRQVLAALFSEGHCLIVGVPGLAKTLLIHSIADLLQLEFRRIQFTPDLMPSDITGATLIHEELAGSRELRFVPGPIFANVILADEINRTPPKTQAALIESMEERQVTAAGRRRPLQRPFFVLATQNPIEQQGTYPLPVTQLDRFQQEIRVDYPSNEEEFRILVRTTSAYESRLQPVLSRAEIVDAIQLVRRVEVSRRWTDYAARVVRRTRPNVDEAPPFVREWISWGAGPRAVQSVLQAARALAFLDGRREIDVSDLHELFHGVLRHRLILNYHAEAEGVRPDDVIDQVLLTMPENLFQRQSADASRSTGWWRRVFRKRSSTPSISGQADSRSLAR